MGKQKILKFTFGLLLSAAFVWFISVSMPLDNIIATLVTVNPCWILLEATTAFGNAPAAVVAFAVVLQLVFWVTVTTADAARFEYWNHLRMK